MRQKQTSTKPALTAKLARDQSVSPVRSPGHSRQLSSPSNLKGTNEHELFNYDSNSKYQVDSTEITPKRINIEISVPKMARNPSEKVVTTQSQEDLIGDSDEEEKSVKMIKSLDAAGTKGFQKNFSENNFQCFPSSVHQNRIQLIVRIRPFLMSEQIKECLKVVNENGIRLFKDFHQMYFKFDNILMPKDNQDGVFARVENITQGFIMGMSGTIFAYGQTGAGKTYSIMGVDTQNSQDLLVSEKKGVLPRTLDFVFSKLSTEKDSNKRVILHISFYEIYNDKITDLLSSKAKTNIGETHLMKRNRSLSQTSSAQSKKLELREEKDGQFSIPDLKRIQVETKEEAYRYLHSGLQKRQISSTSLNNQSSRSHSIFQIYLEKESNEGVMIRSKIRIVDLAGSEKYAIKKDLPQQEKSLRVQELTSINSSLSALGQCISALSDPSRKHIPYRNSKLTKVLKDSLDESSNVALIICISPSIDSYKETLSTLQFADRAKKAILDGRNFSDSKLLLHEHMAKNNQGSVNDLFKAYQEEKAIRKGLELFMKDNTVYEQLDKLKKQNKELQDKVKMLELGNVITGIQMLPESPQSLQDGALTNKESNEDQVWGAALATQKAPLKSCLKKNDVMVVDESEDRINIIQLKPLTTSPIAEEDEDKQKKSVRFAEKLDNDQSLDSDDRERIEHNLKYNDDTIFDNISIFRDVNNSGIVIHQRLQDKKDVHPSKLKNQPIIEDEDDEEEVEEVKQQAVQEQTQQQKVEKDMSFSDPIGGNQHPLPSLISQISDQTMKDFWGFPKHSTQEPQLKMDISIIKPLHKNDSGVSPIQGKKPNNSSQDMSKDLLDLENDQTLAKRMVDLNTSNISDIRFSERSIARSNRRLAPQQATSVQQEQNQNEQHQNDVNQHETNNKCSFIFDPPQKQSQPIFGDNIEEEQSFFQQEEADYGVADDGAKTNFNVCDTTEQFFDGVFYDKEAAPSQRDDLITCGEEILTLQDSMMGLEAAIDVKNIGGFGGNQNTSVDNQNTLLLDSQSMIIDNENQRDLNISQQMNLNEASSILQQRDINQIGQQTLGMNSGPNVFAGQLNNQAFFSLNHPFNPLSGTSSQTHNTDVLTYSLTNTFSTIESLHDELTAIKSGLEQSQKRGNNILKTIQQYAREIEENKITDFYPYQEEDVKSCDEVIQENERIDDSQYNQGGEGDNLNFIKDIKGFYSKIHQEINQLKYILIDSSKNPGGQIESPKKRQSLTGMASRKVAEREHSHLMSDDKQAQTQVLTSQASMISIEGIERTQDIISELRKEIEHILIEGQHSHTKLKRKTQSQDRKSFRVLDLLEVLQTQLMQAVSFQLLIYQLTPVKEHLSNTKRSLTEASSQNIKQANLNADKVLQQNVGPFNIGSQKITRNNFDNPSSSIHKDQQPASDNQQINYEELSNEMSSPRPIHKKQRSSSDHNKSSSGKKKRTPEIFKSLAKLEESEAANSFIDNMNNSHLRNNNYMVGGAAFYSQQSQQMRANQSREMSDHPDFQITLRSYNVNNQGQDFQIQTNSVANLQQHPHINCADFKHLRKSAIGQNQIVGTDNTLTLIFDSDDEAEEQQSEQIYDDEDGLPKVKEVVDDQVYNQIALERCYRQQEGGSDNANNQNEQASIFNEDSKIERASSLGGGNSRLANNLITSSSFQADNSLLFFANNIIINSNPQYQNLLGADINSSQGALNNIIGRMPSQNSNNSFSKDESNVVRGSTPERAIKDLKTQDFVRKKKKNKYLLPQQKRLDSIPISHTFGNKLLLQPAGHNSSDQPSGVSFSQVEDEQAQKQQVRTSEMVDNKFTSKNSVQKYWNQFFNQPAANPPVQNKPAGAKQTHVAQSSLSGVTLTALMPSSSIGDSKTRNQQQPASKSAYQSSSYDLN